MFKRLFGAKTKTTWHKIDLNAVDIAGNKAERLRQACALEFDLKGKPNGAALFRDKQGELVFYLSPEAVKAVGVLLHNFNPQESEAPPKRSLVLVVGDVGPYHEWVA